MANLSLASHVMIMLTRFILVTVWDGKCLAQFSTELYKHACRKTKALLLKVFHRQLLLSRPRWALLVHFINELYWWSFVYPWLAKVQWGRCSFYDITRPYAKHSWGWIVVQVIEQINKLRKRNAKKMQKVVDIVMTSDIALLGDSGKAPPDVHEALLKLLQVSFRQFIDKICNINDHQSLKKASEQHVARLCRLGGFNSTGELFGDADIKNLDVLYPIQVPEPMSREDLKHFLQSSANRNAHWSQYFVFSCTMSSSLYYYSVHNLRYYACSPSRMVVALVLARYRNTFRLCT